MSKSDTPASAADAGRRPAAAPPAGKADTPRSDSDAAHRSGKFGADQPGQEQAPTPRRGADKRAHPQGPEYEEGGQYPGTRAPGNSGQA
ncbi:MAG: hypothetical protein ACN6O8_08260 [Achromobacter sp.]|uniref:hypothetical protein n=1 Tax=Achromobacter sp. TaxID=134375 RepID=UPI003D0299D1